MRALLVGAGGMGKAWARNLTASPDATLAGWIDVRPGAADAAASEIGIAVEWTGTNLDAALSTLKPDFVVDVTPPEVHHEVTLKALAAGAPVIGEKPMAASMAQAREMVAASERAGKLYMVSQSRRYNAQLNALRDLIRGKLGGLGILHADFMIGAHFGGFRDEMDHVLLLDMAIHTFDEARFLSGKDPVSVYAEEYNPGWSWYRGAASANALFEMSGGVRFAYRGSWCAEGLPTSWDGNWRAVGPVGTATWQNDGTPRAEIVTELGGFMSKTQTLEGEVKSTKGGIEGSLAEFLDALRTGATPNGECHDNIKSLAMVFGAIESAKRGERVAIAEILER
ncbi:MAG: Gfo/Idh/MocA family protein [Fimbriimonas sp.]